MVLVVHKDVPGSDYKSLLAYIKSHPGELTFARQVGFAVARQKNAAGHTVSAESRSVITAMDSMGASLPDSLAASFVNAPGAGA